MTWFAYLWWVTLREIRNAILVWLYVTCVHLCVNIQMWVYLWRFGAIVILTGREISFHSCCNETPYGGWSSVTLSSFSSVWLIFTISFSSTFLPLFGSEQWTYFSLGNNIHYIIMVLWKRNQVGNSSLILFFPCSPIDATNRCQMLIVEDGGGVGQSEKYLKNPFLGSPITARWARKEYFAKVLYLTSPDWVCSWGRGYEGWCNLHRSPLSRALSLQHHSGNNTFLQLAGVVYCLFTIF